MAIQKTKLSECIIDEIRQMLLRGELHEGSKLPNQNDFAKQLGVSRLSLREALHTLELLGIIQQRPRIGTIIVIGNPDLWTNKMVTPVHADVLEDLELFDARKAIEVGLAPLTVKNATRDDLEKISDIYQSMARAVADNNTGSYAELDTAFHLSLANASKNRYLIHMFIQILNLTEQFLSSSFQSYPVIMNESLRSHKQMLDSLVNQNEKKHTNAVNAHLVYAKHAITDIHSIGNHFTTDGFQ